MSLRVPRKRAEAPSKGPQFPAGTFLVTLEEARFKKAPEFMLNRPKKNPDGKPQVGSTDNELMQLQFGSGVPMEEDSPDPGNMKFFVDFVVRDGEVSVLDYQGRDDPRGAGWRIGRDGVYLTNLALAMGMVTDNGDGTVSPVDNIIDVIRSGEIKGYKVVVKTFERTWDGGSSTELDAFYAPA